MVLFDKTANYETIVDCANSLGIRKKDTIVNITTSTIGLMLLNISCAFLKLNANQDLHTDISVNNVNEVHHLKMFTAEAEAIQQISNLV